MACFLSGLLALSLATEPPAIERLTPVSVRAMAFTGAGLVTLGVAFEINGLAGIDSRALVPEWREQATFNLAGGAGLIGAGLCLIAIAALLTPRDIPPVIVWVTSGGAAVSLRFPLP